MILCGSFIFYAGWNYRFIPLLCFSAAVDYFLAQAIDQSSSEKRKKLLLALSITCNLGILAIFKYADFAIQSVSDFLRLFGVEASAPLLNIVLPVGVSFYTFQSMSYTIDVYRGDMKPHRGLLQFTAALSFFPQLVAGPILRARQILPQFERIPVPTWDGVKHGLLLITIGLFKKTVADLLAIIVDAVFDPSQTPTMMEAWTGVLAFAGQIYGDFSGYTDMAIGIALLLGFNIPRNFNLPYLASSPIDFWHRWHISLSTWLRDYLYISLGGNKHHRNRNIMITMLLGGLWHGAAWTYIIWGFFHGCILIATHTLAKIPLLRPFQGSGRLIRVVKILVTFYLILIGWVLFRAQSLDSAFDLLQVMHSSAINDIAGGLKISTVMVCIALVLMHAFDYVVIRWGQAIERKFWLLWPLLFVFQLFCFSIGAPSDSFIYFQF